MPPPRDATSSNEGEDGSGRNPPLVIVSEQGRHSEASRRIVRAQAARASAAQSRETRQRNREDRHQREGQQVQQQTPFHAISGGEPGNPQRALLNQDQYQYRLQREQSQNRRSTDAADESEGRLKPLVNWINNVLHLSASSSAGRPQLGYAGDILASTGGIPAEVGRAMEQVQVSGGLPNRRLPVALPRGFANLQKRIQISDPFLVVLSRTACFDFGSPGVENRLHELLFDIVMTSATATMTALAQPVHPIQSHLRIACTCLTIFQGQRAAGQAFAHDQKYAAGLQAAWTEAMALDQAALKEPKSAEAALWSVFIISVTCGATIEFFHELLMRLLGDLQLQYWDQVRNVLLEYIYPGSFLDEPCRHFFEQLQRSQQPS